MSVNVSVNMKQLILTFFITLIVDSAISDGRIAGGHRVTIEEAPYFAHVTHSRADGGNSICSGSILSKRFILTAAHCVTDKNNNFTTLDADAFEVNIETVHRHEGKTVQVAKVHANPMFDGKAENYHHDIGLLELKDDIEFNSKAQPVNLPDEHYTPAVGSEVILSGSGTNPDHHEDSKKRLYQVELQVISAEECYKSHHHGHTVEELEEHEICAKGRGKKSGKGGDSGGPLIEESTNKVVGVVSYGKPKAPTVFCKISDNLDFINSVISGNQQNHGGSEAPPSPPDSVWQELYALLEPYINNENSHNAGDDDCSENSQNAGGDDDCSENSQNAGDDDCSE